MWVTRMSVICASSMPRPCRPAFSAAYVDAGPVSITATPPGPAQHIAGDGTGCALEVQIDDLEHAGCVRLERHPAHIDAVLALVGDEQFAPGRVECQALHAGRASARRCNRAFDGQRKPIEDRDDAGP